MEGWSVVGIDDGVHDSVGDGGDEVPAKWWTEKANIDRGAKGRDDREDEGIRVGWRKEKGPVEICNVSAVEEDGGAWAEVGFEGVEVREGVVFGKKGV